MVVVIWQSKMEPLRIISNDILIFFITITMKKKDKVFMSTAEYMMGLRQSDFI